ncbi:MAG: 5-formyltetrahydrofolate cyclo-ligase [Gammaproteobacteria bacterium]|jgi:5-formyltetrahydrofolate cyclo-ligase|nr:5-formyltetrahydrofolate cyclo-ligase [Gammaproteobacteria bacterium]HEV7444722.1 5-formyltetrahydrofolate cyclo-ligase [Steroidobacteraceae bacterium]
MSDATLASSRKTLRRALRLRRRAVPAAERNASARLVAHHADCWLRLRPSWRIALYAALPEELDATPLIELARARGCSLYLPRIDRHSLGRKMQFVAMNDRQRSNRLGIAEPEGSQIIGARWLDVVFLPLVGFDSRGVRLGTGGGYYDRAFAFRRWRKVWHTPQLVGLAYSFQQLEAIIPAAHDVLLDAVVTEKGVIRCTTG